MAISVNMWMYRNIRSFKYNFWRLHGILIRESDAEGEGLACIKRRRAFKAYSPLHLANNAHMQTHLPVLIKFLQLLMKT